MKSRPKWFLRRDRQARTTTGSDTALAEVLATRGVLTAEQMERAFQRERARVERNEQCFSIGVFRLPAAKTVGTMRESVERMAQVLQNRIRTYDDVGIVDRSSLAVLLPETTGEATWIFADGALAELERHGMSAACEVYTYPHPDNLGRDDGDGDDRGGRPREGDRFDGNYELVEPPESNADAESSQVDATAGSHAHGPVAAPVDNAATGEESLKALLRSAQLIERPSRLRAVRTLPIRQMHPQGAQARLGRSEAGRSMVRNGSIAMSSGSSALASVPMTSADAITAEPSSEWQSSDPVPAPPEPETRPIRDLAPYFEERLPLYRRAADVLVAGSALLALSPVLLTAAVLVKVTSPGPIIFAQARAGRGGRPFQFYKLRSMYQDAEERKNALRLVNEKDGPIFKIKNDPRITPVGKIIRKFSIDELPQLFNVVKGDMTLVGPRPPVMAEVEEYEIWQRQRLDITGGITCIWQVSGRSDVTFREWMRMDVRYRKKRSLGLDLKLVWKTFGAVFSGKGAY